MDEWLKKRTRVKYILIVQFFFLGVEFSIVYPSLPFYLMELETPNLPIFFGIIMASYDASGMITALVLGRLADTTLRFKRIALTINAIALIGNGMYVIGYSPYVILVGRFLGGAIDAMFPIAYGEYGRCYSSEEMQRQASFLMTAYCVGFCIGPGFNLLPKAKEVNLGLLSVRYTNAPGVLLFCGYMVLFMVSCFGLSDLSLEQNQLLLPSRQKDILVTERDALILKNHCTMQYDTEHENKLTCNDKEVHDQLKNPSCISKLLSVKPDPWWRVLMEFLKRTDILVLLYGQVVWSYSLINGTGMIPLVAIGILKYEIKSVAYTYIVAGIFMAIVLWSITKLLIRISIVSLSISGFMAYFVGYTLLILIVVSNQFTPIGATVLFFVFAVCFYSGFCINSVALKAIVSNRVTQENQSFCQGIFSAAEYSASILGGLTCGLSYEVLVYFCGWTVLMNLIAIVVFALYYQTLGKPIIISNTLLQLQQITDERGT